ncbi:MAG: L-threonylcarbamoyladenylate synthase [Pseudomonadota bacterium]
MKTMETYRIDIERPNPRYINKAAEILNNGGLIVYPTDVNYGLGCTINSVAGVKKLNDLTKELGRNKLHTLICRDFSEVSKYAIVSNDIFRAVKRMMPGPYTIILNATPLIPKICQTRRSTIGIRIFEHPVMDQIMTLTRCPMLNFTALPSGDGKTMDKPESIVKLYKHTVDVFIDIGEIPTRYTTVLDYTSMPPVLIREGAGAVSSLIKS